MTTPFRVNGAKRLFDSFSEGSEKVWIKRFKEFLAWKTVTAPAENFHTRAFHAACTYFS